MSPPITSKTRSTSPTSGKVSLSRSTNSRAPKSRDLRVRTTKRYAAQTRPGSLEGLAPAGSDEWQAVCMILPSVRDPRQVTIRRGGLLSDAEHQLLALWAAQCAEHVLHIFESEQPSDPRPRDAIEAARAWARGEMTMMDARARGGHAMGAARPLRGAARFAAYASGQAACVGHVPEHDLGAAAYAIKAAQAADPSCPNAGRRERDWQRHQLPERIRALVLEDQVRRNAICWSVFEN